MKVTALVSCISLSILVLLLFSMAAHATEYREVNTTVKADDILKHIENGEDINLTDCHIVGELNLSSINVRTIPKTEIPETRFLDNEEWELYVSTNKELKVIESNINIQNSIFENNVDFSNVKFSSTFVSFRKTNFTGYANFNEANFGGIADFDRTVFRCPAYFKLVNFTNDSYFNFANFSGPVYFKGAKFHKYSLFSDAIFFDSTHFNSVIFDSSSDFRNAKFKHYTYFNSAIFNNSSSFWRAEFSDFIYFNDADFKSSIFFEDYQVESIITSEENTCQNIMKFFENQGNYHSADIIYYNYRITCQSQKSWLDVSKWIDLAALVTCGYGVKLLHTTYSVAALITLFSFIYAYRPTISIFSENGIPSRSMLKRNTLKSNGGKLWFLRINYWFKLLTNYQKYIRLLKIKGKMITVCFYFQGPGISQLIEKSEYTSRKVSFKDALYFSIATFTTVGSGNWYVKDNCRKWATLEGLLGWVMLGIFMATLIKLMIRS